MRKLIAVGLALAFAPVVAHAAPIVPTVVNMPGTTFNAAALTGFSTRSADMVGSMVTVTFMGGGTSVAAWTATGIASTDWSLTQGGDTFTGIWTLSNLGATTITGLIFNGVPGNTVFDIDPANPVSPGSAQGKAISSVDGPAGMTVNAVYSNQLQIGGTVFGDLYTKLDLTFGGGGLGSGGVLTYVADTDNADATRGGGITPGIPEPGTWGMMIIGFGAVGFAMRRRRTAMAQIRIA